nr:glycosyltransferase [uncultured Selenomonas sp.]
MSALTIILAGGGDRAYLRETAEAAVSAASALCVETELLVPAAAGETELLRTELHGLACRVLSCVGESSAAQWNVGAAAAAGQTLLFLRAGVVLTADGLAKMLEVLRSDETVAAVGPFSNRTEFAWQYMNAEEMASHGEDAAAWVRRHLTQPTDSLFLEDFALLVRRSAVRAVQGFDEAFMGGGADLDLSFRLKYEGFHLLRVPVYFAHRGAGHCDLYDLVRSEARPLLMERWGIDIGLPETILHDTLGAIAWAHDLPIIRATARTALLRAPLVSIMIPTYNRPHYFRETLAGALTQTYPNIEVIVCDNSTDDRTEELMRSYRDDVRVRYVRNREARTKAENFMPFEHLAQGEFLQWCMDDDILLPDKTTRMVDAFLSESEVTLVTSIRGVIDGDGTYLGQWENALPIHGMYVCCGGAAVGRATLVNHANFLGDPSAVLFRRQDLAHHYWRAEARGCRVLSDCAMWLELLEKGNAVIFGRPLSLFRIHGGQEGQRPEALVRAGMEWRHLIEEYWQRRVFLTAEEDYRAALAKLEKDCKNIINPLLPQGSPALRTSYMTNTPSIHIAVVNRIDGCAPMRLDAPLKLLNERGLITLSGCVQTGDPEMDLFQAAPQHDSILLLERKIMRRIPAMKQMLSRQAAQGNIIVHEFDDHPAIFKELVENDYCSFRAVSAVQVSTQYLADELRAFNPHIYLFENQLPSLPERRSCDVSTDRVTIFFGALNRRPDWEPLMPAINEAIRRHGDRLYFRVVSDYGFYQKLRTGAKVFTGDVREVSIVAPYERYTAELHASDIALLPLNDTAFNRAKSDLKFIEAAGHGAAVLAAPTVYAATVRDGETGMIYRSPQEFAEKLDLLIRRADLRRTLAENAYRYVAEHRLLEQHLDERIAAYREMFARREELERARFRRVEKFFPQG